MRGDIFLNVELASISRDMQQIIHTELRVLLKRAGIRQAEFARLAGVTPRQVNKWCQGDAAVPLWVAGYAAALARVSSATIKALASKYHPDQGGTDAAMIRVNAAWEEARRELRR